MIGYGAENCGSYDVVLVAFSGVWVMFDQLSFQRR